MPASCVGPQTDDEAPGRVRGDDDVVVPVAGDDPVPGLLDLVEVLLEVADVVGRLVGTE
jgi:hypothetical protein